MSLRVCTKRLRRLGSLALALSLMAMLLTAAYGCRSGVQTKVNFLRDWTAAKEQAAAENKPIMVNFYTMS